jgi:hypothetical protein
MYSRSIERFTQQIKTLWKRHRRDGFTWLESGVHINEDIEAEVTQIYDSENKCNNSKRKKKEKGGQTPEFCHCNYEFHL